MRHCAWSSCPEGDTTLVLTLPDEARSRYEITKPETITLTAPEASLLSGRQVVGLPRLVLLPTPGFGTLSNSLVSNNSETDVQGGGMRLTVTLSGDSWDPAVGQRGSGAADSLSKRVLAAFQIRHLEESMIGTQPPQWPRSTQELPPGEALGPYTWQSTRALVDGEKQPAAGGRRFGFGCGGGG